MLGLTCKAVRALAPLYAGRELPEMLLRRLDAHEATCSACSAVLHTFEEDRTRLQELQEEVEAQPMGPEMGERFWLEVRRDLRVEGLVGPRPASRRPFVPVGLAWRAAAACLVIGVAVWFGRTSWEQSAGPGGRGVASRSEDALPGGVGPVRVMPVRAGGWELAPGMGGMEPVRREGEEQGWVEPVEPYRAPSRYPLEGWQAPSGDREVVDF